MRHNYCHTQDTHHLFIHEIGPSKINIPVTCYHSSSVITRIWYFLINKQCHVHVSKYIFSVGLSSTANNPKDKGKPSHCPLRWTYIIPAAAKPLGYMPTGSLGKYIGIARSGSTILLINVKGTHRIFQMGKHNTDCMRSVHKFFYFSNWSCPVSNTHTVD